MSYERNRENETLNQVNRKMFSVNDHWVSGPKRGSKIYVMFTFVMYLINEVNTSSCSFVVYKFKVIKK